MMQQSWKYSQSLCTNLVHFSWPSHIYKLLVMWRGDSFGQNIGYTAMALFMSGVTFWSWVYGQVAMVPANYV